LFEEHGPPELDRLDRRSRIAVTALVADPPRAADRALLERISRGDGGALRALYDRSGGAALAIAQRILGSRGEAEEVVQETFVQVWQKARDYDESRGGAVAWVITITRSRSIDRLRQRAASERAVAASSTGDPGPTPIETPLDAAVRGELRQRVAAALRALPMEQRRAIELAYFEGLSQSEIAARTGEPLGTVKTRIRSALGKLAGLLGERTALESS
jgi:RNA polymerase sigma-70 factor (ECF subfamily)